MQKPSGMGFALNGPSPLHENVAPKRMARRRKLSELVLQAVNQGIEARHYKAADLAKLTGRHASNLSEMLAGKRKLALDVIEAAAELRGVDPAEFFIDPATDLKALNPEESEILRYARSWPADVRKAFVTFQAYFATSAAMPQQIRDASHHFGKLDQKKRQLVLGYMTYLREGGMPRDVAIALGLPGSGVPRGQPQRRLKPPGGDDDEKQ